MKFTSIFVGALATFAAAAPTASTVSTTPGDLEARSFAFDVNSFNQFAFRNQDLAYLNVLNSLNFRNLHNLAINNGLNLALFQPLFVNDAFNVQSLVLFGQLHFFNQLAGLGAFNAFDLSRVNLAQFQFGLLDNIAQIQLNQFINQAFLPQITQISSQQAGFLPSGTNSFNNGISVDSTAISSSTSDNDANLDIVTAAEQAAQEGGASLPN